MGKYRFVLKDKGTINQGWWLKISTFEQLHDYYEKVESNLVAKTFKDYLTCREFGKPEEGPVKPHLKLSSTMYLGLYSANRKIGPIEGLMQIQNKKLTHQIQFLSEGYNIYFNRGGGWHFGKNDYSDWYDCDEIIFPEFKKERIRIEKFPMGEHYYAYIDDLQVRDGNILKWDTYKEAYDQAMKIVGENKILK